MPIQLVLIVEADVMTEVAMRMVLLNVEVDL